MKKVIIPMLLAAVFAVSSCYKDKGNYEYNTLDELTISGIGESYTRVLGDTISIIPRLELKKGSVPAAFVPENYTYEWIVCNNPALRKQSLISTDKEWDQHILDVPAGTYNAHYVVTEKATNLKARKTFTFHVVDDLAKGVIMMIDDAGDMRIDYANLFDSVFTLKRDLLKLVDSKLPPQKDPKKLVYFTDRSSMGGVAFYVLTGTGANRLHPTNFSYVESAAITSSGFFVHGFGFPADFVVEDIISYPAYSNRHYLYSRNNIYFYYPTVGEFWNYGTPANRLSLQTATTYKANPSFVSGMVQGPGVFFDDDSQSFLKAHGTSPVSAPFASTLETMFKYNGTGMDLIYMTMNSGERVTALLEDGNKVRWLTVFNGYTGAQDSQIEFTGPDVADITELAVPHSDAKFVYYVSADKKKVYRYLTTDRTFKVAYELPDQDAAITRFEPVLRNIFVAANTGLYDFGIAAYNPSTDKSTMTLLRPNADGTLYVRQQRKADASWEVDNKIVSFILR